MKKINEKKKKRFNALYVFSISLLSLIAIVMGTLIYAKNNPSGEIFGISFATINEKFDGLLNVFKPNLSIDDDQKVSGSPKYQPLENNYYIYENDSVPALKEGTVNSVSSQNGSYFVLISYNNGVTAYYYDLIDIMVKNNDLLKTNDVIGRYEDKFKVIFKKNNNIINYEEAIS